MVSTSRIRTKPQPETVEGTSKTPRKKATSSGPARITARRAPKSHTTAGRPTTDTAEKPKRPAPTRVKPADEATKAYAKTGASGAASAVPPNATTGIPGQHAQPEDPGEAMLKAIDGIFGALGAGLDAAVEPTPRAEARATRALDQAFDGLEQMSRKMFPELWDVLGLNKDRR